MPKFHEKIPSDFRKVIIIGSGPSGLQVAETLRRMEYTG